MDDLRGVNEVFEVILAGLKRILLSLLRPCAPLVLAFSFDVLAYTCWRFMRGFGVALMVFDHQTGLKIALKMILFEDVAMFLG